MKKFLLTAVGAEAKDDDINKLLSNMEGRETEEVIADGMSKLASVPSGGGAPVAAAGGGEAGGGGGGEGGGGEEEKQEEEEEEMEVRCPDSHCALAGRGCSSCSLVCVCVCARSSTSSIDWERPFFLASSCLCFITRCGAGAQALLLAPLVPVKAGVAPHFHLPVGL